MVYLRFTGLTWVLLACMKLFTPAALALHLQVDWGMSGSNGFWVGWLVIVSEALLGIALIFALPGSSGVILGYTSIAAATVLASVSFLSTASVSCGCLGTDIQVTLPGKIAVLAGITFLSATGLRSLHGLRSRHAN